MFITFEGPEGSGKSTQAKLLYERMARELGPAKVLLTREPGGTAIGEQIREVVHAVKNVELAPLTEFLLYNAARAQIVAQVIQPALAAGQIVLCDRFADSTLAYQGYGRQLDLEMVRRVIYDATGGLKPDLTLYFEIGVDEGLMRRTNGHGRGEELNRMDRQTRAFYERVREGYETLIREEPARWIRIDGAGSVAQVHQQVVDKLQNMDVIPAGG